MPDLTRPDSSPSQPIKSAYEQLTTKQKAFVDALCLDPNISATQAAKTAGYKAAGAHTEGYRLLRNAYVRKALGEQLKDVAPTGEEIAARWDRVSQATLDDFFTKRKVEVVPKIKQPLGEAIAQMEAQIAFEEEYVKRAKIAGDDLLNHVQQQEGRRRKVIRWALELESNPKAFRTIDGTPKMEERLELDLVKAQKLGVLDLAKSIKPTQFGIGVELRDADAALDKLARMAGAYEKDNEQSRPLIGIKAVIHRGKERSNG